MRTYGRMLSAVLILVAAGAVCPAPAEVLSIQGSASAEIQQIKNGVAGDRDQASDSLPGTTDTLPIQVVAKLSTIAEEAAGSVAAQFADPLTAPGPNPEEFAINLALDSLSPRISYTAHAITQEVRGVRFSASEVTPPLGGGPAALRGEVFLDGALAVFAVNDITDLTGVSLTLQVTVIKQAEGASPQEVFSGVLQVTGGPDQQLSVTADGNFPRSGVFDADLSAVDPQLGAFRVFVLPNLVLSYPYEATIDQPFTLRATVDVQAANQPNGVGVAAILGTPINTLQEVIAATQGKTVAAKMIAALEQERAAPTGTPVFTDETRPQPMFPACGLLGIESVVGVLLLGGCRRTFRRY